MVQTHHFVLWFVIRKAHWPHPEKMHAAGNVIPALNGPVYGVTDAAFPNDNACKPENALSGEISWDGTTSAIMVVPTPTKT